MAKPRFKADGQNNPALIVLLPMKYYIWLDAEDQPLTKAWRYEDETERMAAEEKPPSTTAVLRAGTRQQLIERYRLQEKDFAD